MCARTDGANEVREAARCLTRACNRRSLRQLYSEVLNEGVPDWANELLRKLD
jgi:hypothetical protein